MPNTNLSLVEALSKTAMMTKAAVDAEKGNPKDARIYYGTVSYSGSQEILFGQCDEYDSTSREDSIFILTNRTAVDINVPRGQSFVVIGKGGANQLFSDLLAPQYKIRAGGTIAVVVNRVGDIFYGGYIDEATAQKIESFESYMDDKRGSANGFASLDANGRIPSSQLPSYVDGVTDVALAQKTINNELEYGYFRSTGSSITAVNNKNILQDFAFYGNMNYSDNLITLKANKKYHIIGTFYVETPPGSTTGGVVFIIIDTDGNHLSQRSYSSNKATNNSTILDTIVTPTEDIQVYVKIDAILGNIAYSPIHSSISISEIGHDITIDPVEYVDTDSGLQDAPVGQIISYMGTTAPEHYLVCDGTVYNIADYPHLSDFINTQFGSKNHFGGDGSTTFAVPDLRGEFLRGTGTNSHAGQGSGATVGTHQDGTTIPLMVVGSNGTLYYVTPNQDPIDLNLDSVLINRNNTRFDATGTTVTNTGKSFYTSRPTNTSVMYCIKYEPTYYMKNVFMNHREETVLFEGDAHVLDQTYTMVDSYENYDEILIYAATSNGVAPPSNIDTKLIATDDIATTSLYPFMWYASTSWFAYLRIDFATTTTFKVNQVAIGQGVSGDNGYMAIYKIMGIKYNETTQEGGE